MMGFLKSPVYLGTKRMGIVLAGKGSGFAFQVTLEHTGSRWGRIRGQNRT